MKGHFKAAQPVKTMTQQEQMQKQQVGINRKNPRKNSRASQDSAIGSSLGSGSIRDGEDLTGIRAEPAPAGVNFQAEQQPVPSDNMNAPPVESFVEADNLSLQSSSAGGRDSLISSSSSGVMSSLPQGLPQRVGHRTGFFNTSNFIKQINAGQIPEEDLPQDEKHHVTIKGVQPFQPIKKPRRRRSGKKNFPGNVQTNPPPVGLNAAPLPINMTPDQYANQLAKLQQEVAKMQKLLQSQNNLNNQSMQELSKNALLREDIALHQQMIAPVQMPDETVP